MNKAAAICMIIGSSIWIIGDIYWIIKNIETYTEHFPELDLLGMLVPYMIDFLVPIFFLVASIFLLINKK